MLKLLTLVAALCVLPTLAHAQSQLLSDRVDGENRICVYATANQGVGDDTARRTLTVGNGQACPETLPAADPNLPIPGNAALVRETSYGGQRQCVYSQAGLDYQRVIPATAQCGMTPDLLNRQLEAGRGSAASGAP